MNVLMKSNRSAFLIALCVLGVACSKSESNKIAYQFSHNGCDTKHHEFDSKEAMCAGLQNESLNEGCAYEQRRQHFEQNCPGQVWKAEVNPGGQPGTPTVLPKVPAPAPLPENPVQTNSNKNKRLPRGSVSVSGAPDNSSQTSTSSMSYKFEENGCSTGTQKFKDQNSMCAGLKNSDLNNGCAENKRKEMFESFCSGQSWDSTASEEPQFSVHEEPAYELSFNGCSTGRQTFETLNEMCQGLLDEELNRGCAKNLRQEMVLKRCLK